MSKEAWRPNPPEPKSHQVTHTPGPWLVAASDFGAQLEVIAEVVSEDEHTNIASVYGIRNELEANARLIAAAPEMAAEIILLKAEIARLWAALERKPRSAP